MCVHPDVYFRLSICATLRRGREAGPGDAQARTLMTRGVFAVDLTGVERAGVERARVEGRKSGDREQGRGGGQTREGSSRRAKPRH